MANLTLTHQLKVYSNGGVEVTPLTQPFPRLWRKPHDLEINDYDDINEKWGYAYRGDGNHTGPVRHTVVSNNKGMPQVYRVYPAHATPLDCRWVQFWKDLNPELTIRSFSTLMGSELAFMNNTGSPPRENCLTGDNAGNGRPAFDQSRLCGGALLKPSKIEGGYFYIEGILTSDPTPDAEELIERKPWLWYWGTNIIPNGKINYMVRATSNGTLIPVRIPILSRQPLYVPLNWLDELPQNFDLEKYDARSLATPTGFTTIP